MGQTTCRVFIGLSLDGYIADKGGGLDWLDRVPNPSGSDLGYAEFTSGIDAIVMGRNTFETVLGFGEWPYHLPVVVMSRSLESIPNGLEDRAEISRQPPHDLIEDLSSRGLLNLYIDGGAVISSFLDHNLIDEMTLSRLPVVLGGGVPLFGELQEPHWLEHVATRSYPGGMVQSTYKRGT